jgi:aminocarboxymuconate-semialdehyde decarboxylase
VQAISTSPLQYYYAVEPDLGRQTSRVINARLAEIRDAHPDRFVALIFLHPLGFTDTRRLTEHFLTNVIGNPLDTTVALSHIIFGGVLERHPRLKFVAAHGGGYLSHYPARMDHAYKVRPECHDHIKRPPPRI